MKIHMLRFLALVLILLCGCGGKAKPVNPDMTGMPEYKPLPGVDSTVVVEALSLADTLFVSFDNEEEAEELLEEGKKEFTESDTLYSLKKIMDLEEDSTITVTSDDSTKAIEYLNLAFGHYEASEKMFEEYRKVGTSEFLSEKILESLTKSRDATVKSIQYNPFDADAKLLLSVIYRYFASIFGNEEDYQQAIIVLRELIRMDRGDHSLYFELGYNYFQMENWESALANFIKAEKLLFENASIDLEQYDSRGDSAGTALDGEERIAPAAVDTSTLLNYTWYQADCLTRLYDSGGALPSYNRALSLVKSDEEREEIEASIKWIEWDDGNIKNVEARDELFRKEKEGSYKDARNGYLSLLPLLTRDTAIDEIDWKIATIDYQFLDEKDDGIERLRGLLDRAIESGIVTVEGAATDSSSLYLTYVNDYGIMCFNLGIEYLTERKKRREAFTYFLQASGIEWENRGNSFVELLKLAQNNPNLTIQYGEKALGHNLSLEERTYVLRQLINAYKRKGSKEDFEKARVYFNDWKRLTGR
jgi:tetratricopeptide (TPR) repeat protein